MHVCGSGHIEPARWQSRPSAWRLLKRMDAATKSSPLRWPCQRLRWSVIRSGAGRARGPRQGCRPPRASGRSRAFFPPAVCRHAHAPEIPAQLREPGVLVQVIALAAAEYERVPVLHDLDVGATRDASPRAIRGGPLLVRRSVWRAWDGLASGHRLPYLLKRIALERPAEGTGASLPFLRVACPIGEPGTRLRITAPCGGIGEE